MKKFLGIVVLGLFLSGNVYSKEIEASNLIDHIDICSFGSSLGQSCKESDFDPNKYFKSGKKLSKINWFTMNSTIGIIILKLSRRTITRLLLSLRIMLNILLI